MKKTALLKMYILLCLIMVLGNSAKAQDSMEDGMASLDRKDLWKQVDKIIRNLQLRESFYESQLLSYYRDKKPFKQMHLYKVNDKIFVSGLNKDINLLTADDMALLKKKSRSIVYDIDMAKKIQRGDAQIVDNDSCEIRANLHGIRYANVVLYLQDHLNIRRFDGFDTSVLFVIESDGRLTCPIVTSGRNVKENKEVIRVLRKTSKDWFPAQKNGKYVRTMQGYRFSFTVKTYFYRDRIRF